MSIIKTKVITVTPQDAERYLSNMCNNRKKKPRRITKLTKSMERGDWGLTGQPIIFSSSGKLLDGQHRMRSVIASGKSVEFLAVYGVDEAMYSKIDDVAPRSISDGLVSVANANEVSTCLKNLYCELNSAHGAMLHQSNYTPTTDESLRLLDEHPGVVDATSYIVGKKRVRAMLGAGLAAYMLYRMRADNRILADEFFAKLHTGEGLSARSPILSLRNVLTDGIKVHGVAKPHYSSDKVCMVAMAWYGVIDRKQVSVTAARARALWAGWRTPL